MDATRIHLTVAMPLLYSKNSALRGCTLPSISTTSSTSVKTREMVASIAQETIAFPLNFVKCASTSSRYGRSVSSLNWPVRSFENSQISSRNSGSLLSDSVPENALSQRTSRSKRCGRLLRFTVPLNLFEPSSKIRRFSGSADKSQLPLNPFALILKMMRGPLVARRIRLYRGRDFD